MADTIKKAFLASGLNMKQLSDESGTRYASVHAFFTATRDPALSTIERWCRVLGLDLVLDNARKRK